MILQKVTDVESMPLGELRLIKNDVEIDVNLSDDYALAAAAEIVSRNDRSQFETKADVVRRAMNTYLWGLGSRGYVAR